MRRVETAGFNKEKLIFIATAAVFAAALYLFLVSGPAMLGEEAPIGSSPSPAALAAHDLAQQHKENWYVNRPNLTRKTPFAPASEDFHKEKRPVVHNAAPPPPPPPPPEKQESQLADKVWDPVDLDIQVEYMGVVSLNGESYALVKPKDGSSPRRIKVGDTVEPFGYQVTAIEKQEIVMKDAENHPFVLKDTRFSGDESDDESGDNSGADASRPSSHAAVTKKAPKVQEQKPAPKKLAPAPAPRPAPPANGNGNGNGKQEAGPMKRRPRPNPHRARPTQNKPAN